MPSVWTVNEGYGHDFKPPKQNDLKQSKKVEILFEHGLKFGSGGCAGLGYRPATLQELDSFLAENLEKSEGQKLLEKIYHKSDYHQTKPK